jgi:hypothetical protein
LDIVEDVVQTSEEVEHTATRIIPLSLEVNGRTKGPIIAFGVAEDS